MNAFVYALALDSACLLVLLLMVLALLLQSRRYRARRAMGETPDMAIREVVEANHKLISNAERLALLLDDLNRSKQDEG